MLEVTPLRLLQDLAVVMIVAGAVTLLFHSWRVPVVLGLILAGMLVGPHLLPAPIVADQESIGTLAELGVVFLMFSLGLDFSLKRLQAVGTTAVVGALAEIVVLFWLGYTLGQWLGWSRMDSLFLGAIICISSTMIVLRLIGDLGLKEDPAATISLGILIVEDIVAIALIALLSGVAVSGTMQLDTVLWMLAQIGAFFVLVVVIGLLLVPPLLRRVARFQNDEMLLITVLALCFGVALVAVRLGYSVALGAFLIGTVITEAREINKVRLLTGPVRDMFSAVFFVSIGMLIDPWQLLRHWPVLLATIAVVVLGKVLIRTLAVALCGHGLAVSLRSGTLLVTVGEFSFIIAALGSSLQVTSSLLYPVAVGVSVGTTLLAPLLVRRADRWSAALLRGMPAWLVQVGQLYTRWLERLRAEPATMGPRKLLRRWAWQILLNMLVVSALLIGAAAMAQRAALWWPNVPEWVGGARGLIWLWAAVLTLPSLIAAIRKLEAAALLLAEVSVGSAKRMPGSQAVLFRIIFGAGLAGLGLWVLMLSWAVLPRWPAIIMLGLVVAGLAYLLWRFLIQIHAKAQIAIRETFAALPAPSAPEPAAPLPSLLKEARLETIALVESMPAAGKLIGELELRARTGASIVALERADGPSLVNPGPETHLQSGDKVLLLGTPDQLTAARAALTEPAIP